MAELKNIGKEALELVVKKAYKGNFQEWLGDEVTVEAVRISNGIFGADYLYHENGRINSEKREIHLKYSRETLSYKLLDPKDKKKLDSYDFDLSEEEFNELHRQKKVFLSYKLFSEQNDVNTPLSITLTNGKLLNLKEKQQKLELIAGEYYTADEISELTGKTKGNVYVKISTHKEDFSERKNSGWGKTYLVTEDNKRILERGLTKKETIKNETDPYKNHYTVGQLAEKYKISKPRIYQKLSKAEKPLDKVKRGRNVLYLLDDNIKELLDKTEDNIKTQLQNHYTASELAKRYGISTAYVYMKLAKATEALQKVRDGKNVLYLLDDRIKVLLDTKKSKKQPKGKTENKSKFTPQKDYYSIDELVNMSGLKKATLYNIISDNKESFPKISEGKRRYYKITEDNKQYLRLDGKSEITDKKQKISKSKAPKDLQYQKKDKPFKHEDLEEKLKSILVFGSLEDIPRISIKEAYTKGYFLEKILRKPVSYSQVIKQLIENGELKTTRIQSKKRESLTGLSIMSLLNKYATVNNISNKTEERQNNHQSDSKMMIQKFAETEKISLETLFDAIRKSGIEIQTIKGIGYIDSSELSILKKELKLSKD